MTPGAALRKIGTQNVIHIDCYVLDYIENASISDRMMNWPSHKVEEVIEKYKDHDYQVSKETRKEDGKKYIHLVCQTDVG